MFRQIFRHLVASVVAFLGKHCLDTVAVNCAQKMYRNQGRKLVQILLGQTFPHLLFLMLFWASIASIQSPCFKLIATTHKRNPYWTMQSGKLVEIFFGQILPYSFLLLLLEQALLLQSRRAFQWKPLRPMKENSSSAITKPYLSIVRCHILALAPYMPI